MLITSSGGERLCVREAYNLLNEVSRQGMRVVLTFMYTCISYLQYVVISFKPWFICIILFKASFTLSVSWL